MIIDARKLSRGVGRFLTTRSQLAAGRLNTLTKKYNEVNDASGGVVGLVLGATPIPQMVSTVYNPLVTTIEATNALGRGLSTLGRIDVKKLNTRDLGSGIQDLKMAYDLGNKAIQGRGMY